ncbi:hypothetical protein B0H10DRAFT_942705 [Mycena sp. CBHHK59/15]|nr:hypothetical protein B0H10DRAFT_942705 [Mycena sp. CBHHK59/15]
MFMARFKIVSDELNEDATAHPFSFAISPLLPMECRSPVAIVDLKRRLDKVGNSGHKRSKMINERYSPSNS